MYEAFHGLREKPFALTPDPSFLYPTRHHAMALSLLEYGLLNQAGFCLVTGEVGSGKTTLIRHWLNQAERATVVGLITNTHRGFGGLLQWVCVAFALDHRGKDDAALYDSFVGFLVEQYGRGKRAVLVVDEAQNLDAAMLEELRVLSNINADKHMVLQTILVGQPELRATLQQPGLRQFAQRISVDYHLPALTALDSVNYVRHRMRVAGAQNEIFPVDAILVAHVAANGVPRLLNLLCDTALVYAFADQERTVSAALMRQVVADRERGGLWPQRSRPAPAAQAQIVGVGPSVS